MLQRLFHAWERRLAAVTTDRVVRPFEWGLDWIPENGRDAATDPADRLGRWISEVMADSDAFFTPPPTTDYTLTPRPNGDVLTFPSAFTTPHDENNTVYARYFPARPKPSRSSGAKASADVRYRRSARASALCSGPCGKGRSMRCGKAKRCGRCCRLPPPLWGRGGEGDGRRL